MRTAEFKGSFAKFTGCSGPINIIFKRCDIFKLWFNWRLNHSLKTNQRLKIIFIGPEHPVNFAKLPLNSAVLIFKPYFASLLPHTKIYLNASRKAIAFQIPKSIWIIVKSSVKPWFKDISTLNNNIYRAIEHNWSQQIQFSFSLPYFAANLPRNKIYLKLQ